MKSPIQFMAALAALFQPQTPRIARQKKTPPRRKFDVPATEVGVAESRRATQMCHKHRRQMAIGKRIFAFDSVRTWTRNRTPSGGRRAPLKVAHVVA